MDFRKYLSDYIDIQMNSYQKVYYKIQYIYTHLNSLNIYLNIKYLINFFFFFFCTYIKFKE